MEPEEAGAFTITTPHRGSTVVGLGAGALASVLLACSCCPVFLLSALPLAIVAWVTAEQDLRGMRAGTVDAAGRQTVVTGKGLAIAALCLCAVWVLILVAGFLLAVLSDVG